MGEIEIAIEHLEPRLSKWILLEYSHVSKMIGRDKLHFTNVVNEKDRRILEKYGIVHKESIVELIQDRWDNILVLEPKANKLLKPKDFINGRNLIVIGGIMGDHPPRGRTYELLTSKMLSKFHGKVKPVSLGKHQFSIDGAAYMAIQVFKGLTLDQIPIVVGVKIKVKSYIKGVEHEIYLPYTYPLINGKPLLAPGLREYLERAIVLEELNLIEKNIIKEKL